MTLRFIARCIFASALLLAGLPPIAAAFTVSGTAQRAGAIPVANVEVLLFDGNGIPIGIPPTFTSGTGLYSISNLPSGTYELGFEPPTVTKLLPKNLTGININANVTVDVVLDAGFLLSGFVRDLQGVGIFDIDLNVVDRDTNTQLNTPGDNTDATGFYDIVVPSGRFDITWRDVTPGAPNWIAVEQRDVQISADMQIDVTMEIGVFVSGVVRNTGGTPIANINMDFIDAATGIKLDTPGDVTDVTGTYHVQIPAKTYDVRAKPLPATHLVGAERTDVAIFADTATLDFVLQSGFTLTGTVTRSGGIPVPDVDVDVANPTTGSKIYTPFDLTDAGGQYQIVLPAGTWHIIFEPPVSTLQVPVQFSNFPMTTDTQLNVVLSTGVLLSGTVRNAASAPVANVNIDAKPAGNPNEVPLVGDLTDAGGVFSVVVAPGTYDLEFEPPTALGLVAARSLGVVINTTTNLMITLQPGVHILGGVTDLTGVLLGNTAVDVIDVSNGQTVFTPNNKTNSIGRYDVVVLKNRTYNMVFTPDPSVIVAAPLTISNVVVGIANKVVHAKFPALITTGVGLDPAAAPPLRVARLHQNTPNPFNPTSRIRFDVERGGSVRLDVLDVRGRLVRTLVSGRSEAGSYLAAWDGVDASGRAMPSGTYICMLRFGGDVIATRKMVLFK